MTQNKSSAPPPVVQLTPEQKAFVRDKMRQAETASLLASTQNEVITARSLFIGLICLAVVHVHMANDWNQSFLGAAGHSTFSVTRISAFLAALGLVITTYWLWYAWEKLRGERRMGVLAFAVIGISYIVFTSAVTISNQMQGAVDASTVGSTAARLAGQGVDAAQARVAAAESQLDRANASWTAYQQTAAAMSAKDRAWALNSVHAKGPAKPYMAAIDSAKADLAQAQAAVGGALGEAKEAAATSAEGAVGSLAAVGLFFRKFGIETTPQGIQSVAAWLGGLVLSILSVGVLMALGRMANRHDFSAEDTQAAAAPAPARPQLVHDSESAPAPAPRAKGRAMAQRAEPDYDEAPSHAARDDVERLYERTAEALAKGEIRTIGLNAIKTCTGAGDDVCRRVQKRFVEDGWAEETDDARSPVRLKQGALEQLQRLNAARAA